MKLTDSQVTVEVNWAGNLHETMLEKLKKQSYTITVGDVSVPATYVDHVNQDGEVAISILLTKENELKLAKAIEDMK